MWDIVVVPIRGCAHVKVYLKSSNEAWSNGSWSCRHRSLTLFHWRQWGRRERGLVPSALATVEKRQVQYIWAKALNVLDFWDFYLLETKTLGCLLEKWSGKGSLLICYAWFTFESGCVGVGCFVHSDVCMFCLLSLFLHFFSLAHSDVVLFSLFEPSALHHVGQATRCERWSVWLALMVLSWMTLNVMLPPDPLTPR